MVHDELPHPRRTRENLPRSALVDEVQVGVHGLPRGRRAVDDLQIAPNQRDEPREVLLDVSPRPEPHVPVQNLQHGVLAALVRAVAANAGEGRFAAGVRHAAVGEPELLLEESVPLLRALHVLVHLGHGDVQLQVVEQDGAAEKAREHGERRVLKLGEHDLHGSELDAPRFDRASNGGGFPAHALPVGRLDVLDEKRREKRVPRSAPRSRCRCRTHSHRR